MSNDFSSINLRNDFGIVLSNDEKFWNQEDAFRLYSTINQIPVFMMTSLFLKLLAHTFMKQTEMSMVRLII